MENFDDLDTENDERMDGEYSIYVQDYPPELDEMSLKDIFKRYGTITGVYCPPNATWAFITYGTFREAECAIREVNNKKPLYIKVSLAKPRNKRNKKSNEVPILERKPADVTESPSMSDTAHRQNASYYQPMNAYCRNMPQITVPYTDSEAYPSLHTQPYDVYHIKDPYMNTNRLWSRGVMTVTPDGKKHVSLGRGYTLYEFPEDNPKIESNIEMAYEKRYKGLYEHGKKPKIMLQQCYVCSIKTTKHCEKCLTYYCSRLCQVNDWPRHQAECERIPALVEDIVNDTSSLQINKDENKASKMPSIPSNVTNKTIASNDVKLRRPNTMQTENSNSTSADTNKGKNNANFTSNSPINTKSQDGFLSAQQNSDINVPETKKADQLVTNVATNAKDFSQQRQLHRYNESEGNDDKSSSTMPNSNRQSHNRNYQINTNKFSPRERLDNNSNIRSKGGYNTDKNQSYQKHGFQNDRKFTPSFSRETGSQKNSSSSDTDDDLALLNESYLSKTEFTNVEVIVPLDNYEYWIYKLEDMNARVNLMSKLQEVAQNARNVHPIVGYVYGVLFQTIWHRARVISLNPIKVHFIDFGNDEVLEHGAQIKDIRETLKVPRFARKIRLSQATIQYKNLQCDDKISVRMLSMDDRTIVVEVQESKGSLINTAEDAPRSNNAIMNNATTKSASQENLISSNINIRASTIQIPNVLKASANLIKKGTILTGIIQIIGSLQKNVYCATLCPQNYSKELEMLLKDLQEECAKIEKSADYKPEVDNLICGKGEDGWYRGYVLTSSDFHIISIDEAKLLEVDTIVPYPKEFLNICAFGVTCTVNHPSELEVGQVYAYTIISHNTDQESLNIEIGKTANKQAVAAVVKSWESLITKPDNKVFAFSEIKSGSKICLTSYRNQCVMYARSLDEPEVEYYNNIMQRVARCAQTAPNLSEPPIVEKIVLAPYCDDNYYRAMVMKVHSNSKAQIVYIDFGNIDDININVLKVLPDDLALQRCCAAKITLKDVSRDVPMNAEADLYLRNLIGKEIPLTCAYEGEAKGAIHLTMPTGESVNEKLNQLLVPNWKQKDNNDALHDKRYIISDMEVANLGSVGETVDGMITFVHKTGKHYMISPIDIDLITHVTEVMPAQLQEYCDSTEYYIPRVQELCLALYEDAWYRAVCLDPKASNTTAKIFFVDYGNIESVEHKNIRLMPKDFVSPAAMANDCAVINLAPLDTAGHFSPAVERKISELLSVNSVVKVKIVECVELGEYKVELPVIRTALSQ